MKPDDEHPKKKSGSRSRFAMLLSIVLKTFFQSFFRTVTFIAYLGMFASGFLAEPKGIDLLAGPLSLVGLWMLLYNFDLLLHAAKR
jgi:hypothetical protein